MSLTDWWGIIDNLIIAFGSAVAVYLLTGIATTAYVATRSDEVVDHAQELIEKHQNEYLDSEEAADKRNKEGMVRRRYI